MILLTDRAADDLGERFADYPFPFTTSYRRFYRQQAKQEIALLLSDCKSTAMPIRVYKVKGFRFSQLLYPPLQAATNLHPADELDFLSEAVHFLQQNKICQRIVQPPTYCLFQSPPQGSIACSFGSYRLRLQQRSDEELFANLHSKHRNVIRKVTGKVQTAFGPAELKNFYTLYHQTMVRAKLHCEPLSYFEALYACLSEKNLLCGVVYHEELPLAGLLMPYSRSAAFYLFGGTAEETPINGANNYLHWEAIKRLRAANVDHLDYVGARLSPLEGTKYAGMQRFKARFGGTLHKGYLWKMNILPWQAKFFDFMLQAKQIMRGRRIYADIIDQERHALQREPVC